MNIRLTQRHKGFILGGAFVIALCVWLTGLNAVLPMNEDTSLYINMASSLSQGKGLLITNGVTNKPGNYYPFLYPAMIAPLVNHGAYNFLALKLVTIFLAILFLAAVVYACRKLYFRQFPLLVAVFICLSSQVALYADTIQTEIPFTLFSFCAVWCLEQYGERKGNFSIFFFLSAFFLFCAMYTRLIGISLLFAVPAWLVLKKDYRKAGASLLFFCLLLPWLIQYAVLGSVYVKEFSGSTATVIELVHRWLYNLACTIGKELPDLFFDPRLAGIDPFSKIFFLKLSLGCVLAYLLLKGFILKLKKESLAFWDIYVFVYFCFLYLSWTTHGARYLVPIMVFLAYYLFIGLKSIIPDDKVFYGAAAVIIALNLQGGTAAALQSRLAPFSASELSLASAADWIQASTPRESIIMSRKPSWIYLRAGRRGLRFLRYSDPGRQMAEVSRNRVDYIVIDRNKIFRDDSRDYLLPLVSAYPGNFEKVFDSGGRENTLIYRVKR